MAEDKREPNENVAQPPSAVGFLQAKPAHHVQIGAFPGNLNSDFFEKDRFDLDSQRLPTAEGGCATFKKGIDLILVFRKGPQPRAAVPHLKSGLSDSQTCSVGHKPQLWNPNNR